MHDHSVNLCSTSSNNDDDDDDNNDDSDNNNEDDNNSNDNNHGDDNINKIFFAEVSQPAPPVFNQAGCGSDIPFHFSSLKPKAKLCTYTSLHASWYCASWMRFAAM